VSAAGESRVPLGSKEAVAAAILDEVEAIRATSAEVGNLGREP
jgi:hypothetical protein